jgi:long-chain acyl-CoA synthetase
MRCAVSGGGALPTHVDHLLLGIGMPLLNGYGLTETSPVVCVRPPEDNRVGTIGPAIPHTQLAIRDEAGNPVAPGAVGLLWIKGPQVMQGYYRNLETTRLVLTEDGWFNSGDLAKMDARGHFSITGRAKDTIVLSGGENVEPEPVETGIKASGLVDQAVVLGQDQKVLGAILIPMPEQLEQVVPRAQWGEVEGELTGEGVREVYRKELDRMLCREAGFRPCEKVARFKVRLEPMTVENGLLTPTMKVKRHEVAKQMAGMIEGLFD